MISRARVYAASPVFNANWDNPASERWQAALDASLAAEAAANGAGYGSSVSNIDSWDKAFYAFNGMHNPEAIIKIPKSDNVIHGAFNNGKDIFVQVLSFREPEPECPLPMRFCSNSP